MDVEELRHLVWSMRDQGWPPNDILRAVRKVDNSKTLADIRQILDAARRDGA